jgi:hypothetical protein
VQRLRGYRSRLGAVVLLAVIFVFVLAPSAIWLLAMFATCVTLAQAGWLPPSFLRGPWAPYSFACSLVTYSAELGSREHGLKSRDEHRAYDDVELVVDGGPDDEIRCGA